MSELKPYKMVSAYVFADTFEEWKEIPDERKIHLDIAQWFRFGDIFTGERERGQAFDMDFSILEAIELRDKLNEAIEKADKYLTQNVEELESRLTN